MRRIGADTGGTFTDLICLEAGSLSSWKLPSTPDAYDRAVLEGARHLAEDRVFDLLHSTTVATNALLERKGATTALVTTRGFRDVLEIGRQNRPRLYDLAPRRARLLIPRERRFEISGRVGADGSVRSPLDESELPDLVEALRASGARSVAVVLLFSFLHPDHEQTVGRALREAGFTVSLSHEILPEFREYERASTTAANAYVGPAMQGYLDRLLHGARDAGAEALRIVQSNGGCLTPERAGREAVHTLLSGPAAGIQGAVTLARAGDPGAPVRLITFDMGGTSTDVALIDGDPAISTELTLEGLPIGVPMVDVHTVGAGGGSLASVDAGGALRVGPESAGAFPGPACYGNGDQPTVTDANLVLGRLQPDYFLQGRRSLEVDRSHRALTTLANAMGETSPERAAHSVIRLVNLHMEAAIRVISVERGHDPRDFTLVGFGGAGGLHVFALAEALDMSRVMIPAHPGVLSALGAVAGPVMQDLSRTVMRSWTEETLSGLSHLMQDLENELIQRFRTDGLPVDSLTVQHRLDLRYQGQSFELSVPVSLQDPSTAADLFHHLHRQRYGHAEPEAPLELVTLRVRGQSPAPEIRLPDLPPRMAEDAAPGLVPGPDGMPLLQRDRLRRGDVVRGPALIVEDYATHLIPDGWTVSPDRVGNLCGNRESR